MERVVSKELQHVTIAILGPSRVAVQFSTIHNCVQFREKPEESSGLDILGQLVFESISPVVRLV